MVDATFWFRAAAQPFALLTAALPTQGSWSPTPTTGSPTTLTRHAAAYDLSRSRMVLFGGHDASSIALARTWEFDGVHFTPVFPLASPPARVGGAMAYDPYRQVVVLFGGAPTNAVSGCLDDTWEFDGSTWTRRTAHAAPPARVDHAMCFDLVSACCVVFGGRAATTLADTWTFDGATWPLRSTTRPN
ncbi:MAG: hypothetical protein KDE27_05370 [Planctomycetes bacterium]|nr:hypothetical protein [Planctomycetota bacterium]